MFHLQTVYLSAVGMRRWWLSTANTALCRRQPTLAMDRMHLHPASIIVKLKNIVRWYIPASFWVMLHQRCLHMLNPPVRILPNLPSPSCTHSLWTWDGPLHIHVLYSRHYDIQQLKYTCWLLSDRCLWSTASTSILEWTHRIQSPIIRMSPKLECLNFIRGYNDLRLHNFKSSKGHP